MKSKSVKTYSKQRPEETVRRNPFDELLQSGSGKLSPFSRSSSESSGRTSSGVEAVPEPVSGKTGRQETARGRPATPYKHYPLVSRKPVRSPRISKMIASRTSSSEDEEGDDDSWTDQADDSSIEIPREATEESCESCIAIEPLVKLLSPLRNPFFPSGSETSETTVEKLNSTLLDDSLAKNLNDLKELEMSPIADQDEPGDSFARTSSAETSNNTNDDEFELKQCDLENTPAQKLLRLKPNTPAKITRRSLKEVTSEKTDPETEVPDMVIENIQAKRKLSPIYNKVCKKNRRIQKKTSTPVRRRTTSFESPPMFLVDISSVRLDSNSDLCINESCEVNSEEIHVSVPSSPMQPTATGPKRSIPGIPSCPSKNQPKEAADDRGRGASRPRLYRQGLSMKTKRAQLASRKMRAPVHGKIKKRQKKNGNRPEKGNGKMKSTFSFGVNSCSEASDAYTPPKLHRSLGKLSESPSRENNKRKSRAPCYIPEKKNLLVTAAHPSPPSSGRKNVTWGSTTLHEYDQSSPVLQNSPSKIRRNIPICAIQLADICFPPWKFSPTKHKNLPPLRKNVPSYESLVQKYGIDVLSLEFVRK